jgi:hypothetical protein
MKLNTLASPLLAATLAFLPSCSKKEEAASAAQPVVESIPVEPPPFSPPENGLLTEGQVKRFLEAHKAMVKVNDIYLDSLSAAGPDKQRSVYQALDIARDKVSRRFGLNGFAEYRWILEDAPRHPANVRILRELQVTTVTR